MPHVFCVQLAVLEAIDKRYMAYL